jgi:hypothetical protein
MQSGSNPTVDANAAIPIEFHKDDPRHMNNLIRNIASLNAQSSSDTKYDPKPPPRVDRKGNEVNESFSAKLDISDTKIHSEILYACGALASIILIMVIFAYLDPKMFRIISQIDNGFLYINVAAIISLISMGVAYYGYKINEIMLWYPALKPRRIVY